MKSKLLALLLLCSTFAIAQPYKEFKWKDSTGAGGVHVGVPMIPGSQMVITGTIDDPTVIMWNDTLLYIASKDYTAGVYATIANLALKKDKNDTTDATGYMRVWQLGLSFQKGDTADASVGFFSRPYMTTLMGYKYDKSDTNSSSKGFYPRNLMDAMLLYYYLRSDTNDAAKGFYPRQQIDAILNACYLRSDTGSTTKGFYTKQMVDALIAEAIVTSGSGTVTSVASGNGLTGGPITTTGTLKIDTTIKATAALTGFLGFADFSSFALAVTRASKFAADSSLYLQMDDTTTNIVSKNYGGNQYQPKDADLTTFAGISPSANAQTLLGNTFAQMLHNIGAPDSTLMKNGSKVDTIEFGNKYQPKATMPTVIGVACSDETTALTASTSVAKITFRVPYAMTVTAVRASVTTAPTGATILVDIHESGTTILSTKVMIDASEFTSTTAATGYVISDSALADDSEITVYADQVGSSVAGAGLKIWIIGTRIAP